MGTGISTVYGDAQWAEAASFAALLPRSAAASGLLGPAAPLLLFRLCACAIAGTAGGGPGSLAISEREEEPAGEEGRNRRVRRQGEMDGGREGAPGLGDHGQR